MIELTLGVDAWKDVEPGVEALVDKWWVAEGDAVRAGQVLANVVLVKANQEIVSPAGGRIVLPHGHPWGGDGLMGSYRRLGQLHVTALSRIGVSARALPPWEVPRANAAGATRAVNWACFGSLSPWELVDAGGRKLVGLAQRRRTSGVLLVAGTLIGSADWSLLCDVMGHSEDVSMLRRRTVSSEEIAGRSIEPERFASVLRRSLMGAVAMQDACNDLA